MQKLIAACIIVLVLLVADGSEKRAVAARALLSTELPTAWAENLDLLTGVDIPSEIAVPAGHSLQGVIRAEGHQHYQFNGTAWVLRNATAKLYNSAAGTDQVGRHFFLPEPDNLGGQPTWESVDDSHVPSLVSAVTAKALIAHSVDTDSITWNLLIATSHYGNDLETLGHVTYVQRLKTRRGLPPSSVEGVNKDDIHSSKYHAIYAFYIRST